MCPELAWSTATPEAAVVSGVNTLLLHALFTAMVEERIVLGRIDHGIAQ
jgi:hypothetical protein